MSPARKQKKSKPAKPAKAKRAVDNGLRAFAMHSDAQPDFVRTVSAAATAGAAGRFGAGGGAATTAAITRGGASAMAALDAETAARHYLRSALASPAVPAFAAAEVGGDQPEFKTLGTDAQPLTGTQTVKFRQTYQKIPVYGSLVTIELGDKNELVSMNSGLGEPSGVDPVAKVSPAAAVAAVKKAAGGKPPISAAPRLYFYFDDQASKWRLVYVLEDVPKAPKKKRSKDAQLTGLPEYSDFFVDAHSGKVIAEMPRTHNATVTGVDGLNAQRQFDVSPSPAPSNKQQMNDATLGVRTHDFNFKNVSSLPDFNRLPGPVVENPPNPWSPAAVSAHCNAAEVARFLRDVLKRNSLDDMGMPIVSSVNCVASQSGKEWRNAAWLAAKKQMVYGQRKTTSNQLVSYAVSLDVVAHEILHGLTDHTARLVYRGMSGALNESYSDIFGIIVSNLKKPSIDTWDWRLGEDLSATGIPIRDLSDPTKHGQPAHMNDFVVLPLNEENDWGGVHINSGIHNKAAFNLITSKDTNGAFLFTGADAASIYYLALTQQLASTSVFADSRRGVDVSARSLFRNDPDKDAKVAAVARAFDDVGIL